MSSFTTFDTTAINAACDLRELAARYTTLKRPNSKEPYGPCPRCDGRDRFHVREDWWFCRQCYSLDNGERHDAIAFLQWVERLDFKEACERLGGMTMSGKTDSPVVAAKPTGFRWHEKWWQDRAKRFLADAQRRLEMVEGESARAYLASRSLLPATWRAWGLGFASPKHRDTERPHPAIVLPWRGGGTIKALQYRFFGEEISKGQRFSQMPSGERTIFGVDLLGKHGHALIAVEGELNALSIWQALGDIGLRDRVDVVSFGADGNVVNPRMLDLARMYQYVVVWADKEEKARAFMAAHPGAQGLKSPQRGDQELDANELLRLGQLDAFLAKALERQGVTSPSVQAPAVEAPIAEDPFRQAFDAALENTDGWYQPGLMGLMREHCPDLADRAQEVGDQLDALWGQDLEAFQKALEEWLECYRLALWRIPFGEAAS